MHPPGGYKGKTLTENRLEFLSNNFTVRSAPFVRLIQSLQTVTPLLQYPDSKNVSVYTLLAVKRMTGKWTVQLFVFFYVWLLFFFSHVIIQLTILVMIYFDDSCMIYMSLHD